MIVRCSVFYPPATALAVVIVLLSAVLLPLIVGLNTSNHVWLLLILFAMYCACKNNGSYYDGVHVVRILTGQHQINKCESTHLKINLPYLPFNTFKCYVISYFSIASSLSCRAWAITSSRFPLVKFWSWIRSLAACNLEISRCWISNWKIKVSYWFLCWMLPLHLY